MAMRNGLMEASFCRCFIVKGNSPVPPIPQSITAPSRTLPSELSEKSLIETKTYSQHHPSKHSLKRNHRFGDHEMIRSKGSFSERSHTSQEMKRHLKRRVFSDQKERMNYKRHAAALPRVGLLRRNKNTLVRKWSGGLSAKHNAKFDSSFMVSFDHKSSALHANNGLDFFLRQKKDLHKTEEVEMT